MMNNSPHLCVQFSGVYCIHRAGQPSPLPNSRALPSPQKETPYLLESLHILHPGCPLSPSVSVSVQLLSRVQLFAIPWTVADQASLSSTISQSFLKLCSLSHWCHATISSSVVPFSSCLQSFPASGSFLMSWPFSSDDQSTGVSASDIQGWFWFASSGYFI